LIGSAVAAIVGNAEAVSGTGNRRRLAARRRALVPPQPLRRSRIDRSRRIAANDRNGEIANLAARDGNAAIGRTAGSVPSGNPLRDRAKPLHVRSRNRPS
jgi:hypothetical protein